MRITFLVPHLRISGGVKIVCEYARRLAHKKHQVTLISRQRNFSGLRNLIHKMFNTINWIDLNGVNVVFAPELAEQFIPAGDVIFASSWKTAAALNRVSADRGRKFYLIQHLEGMIEPADAPAVAETYSYPMAKIAVSGWLQDELKTMFSQASELISNPIDPEEFYPESMVRLFERNELQPTIPGGNSLRSNCQSKKYGSKRVGMLYHTAEWKGFPDGLKAIELVRKVVPDVRLVLFGARHRIPLRRDWFEYHRNAGPAELRRIYSGCDVFICPSWYEGFGLPGLEAMACGTALATTDNGGCRDYAIHKETALVSPPKSPEALAENVIKLLQDADLLKKISENGCRRSLDFRWDDAITKMERVICQA